MVKWAIIRAMMLVATQKNWKLSQMDVKMVFLREELKEEVYVTQLQGFEVPGKEQMVC